MEPRVRLEAGGKLTGDDDVKKRVGSREGDYRLLPTGPDWVCLLRTPPLGGAGKPEAAKGKSGKAGPRDPDVVLSGDAGGFPISDLIAFLSQARYSGLLRVSSPTGERSLSLREGEVRGASSDDPADRLGEVLVRLGYAKREEVERTMEEHPPSRVGRAMVERGLIQSHDLWRCLNHQVSEIFHAIVLCREGVFTLAEQDPEDRGGKTLQISTQSLLMDSIRKIDEMAHFRKRIPHGRVYVLPKKGSDGGLEEEEEALLKAVDGTKTLLELAQSMKLSEFDTTKIVFRLLEGQFVQISERKPGDEAHDDAGAARVVRVFNGIFREIRGEVQRQGRGAELVAAANEALAKEAVSGAAFLKGLTFDAKGALPEPAVLARLAEHGSQLGGDPAASLKRVLSDVMFFLLFQAGELLESSADEGLARRVKEMLASLED